MARIKVRFSFVNRATNSVICGVRNFEGGKGVNTFAGIADKMTGKLKRIKAEFMRNVAPAECPDRWEVNGFQCWHEWNKRTQRALAGTGRAR